MFKRIIITAAAVVVAAPVFAFAAEDLGVKIYPGATRDEQWSRVQAETLNAVGGGTGVCYRTKDTIAKVGAFYQNEGFKIAAGQVLGDGAMLLKGEKLSMTLRNMKPLDNSGDTRICIGKK